MYVHDSSVMLTNEEAIYHSLDFIGLNDSISIGIGFLKMAILLNRLPVR